MKSPGFIVAVASTKQAPYYDDPVIVHWERSVRKMQSENCSILTIIYVYLS